MKLRGGVIIIGSLLWDNENRKKWRENNLSCKDGFRVCLPIRYGRFSTTRNETYTMVFSNKCYSKEYGLGTGWILPIKEEINSFPDLEKEAREMGKAEGFNDGLSNNWGSVALILNPNKEIGKFIGVEWARLMRSKISVHLLLTTKLKTEKSPIDSEGFLTIRWPDEVISKNRIEKLDFLIAIVTLPTLIKGRYPKAYKIADAMKKANYYDYFLKNREHGITTFQDEKLSKLVGILI